MANEIVFNKIQRRSIFCQDFECLSEGDNKIDFSSNKIAIIYGPNGVGKTSFAKVLSGDSDTQLDFLIDGKQYTEKDTNLFHVIEDQNGRNIIKGETHEFLLGDNIEREYKLKEAIDEKFVELFKKTMPIMLKTEFNISSKSSKLINFAPSSLKGYIGELANSQNRGKDIDKDQLLRDIQEMESYAITDYEEEKYSFLKTDCDKSESIIAKILKIKEDNIRKNKDIRMIDEYDHAIGILTKFIDKKECIICDNEINSEEILEKKQSSKELIITSLDEDSKEILKNTINAITDFDPFSIKEMFYLILENGDVEPLNRLIEEIEFYLNVFEKKLNNEFINCVLQSKLQDELQEYNEIIANKPEFDGEDILFIQKIVSDNIGRDIILDRDKNNNLKILMDNSEFLGKERNELNLSNGEQNFISLSFELLKARKSEKDFIVLDDPISSFDSIYKNKIAFVIIKFLENKLTIILTHNLDLVRLMEVQRNNCFSLYLFNNTPNERNGFILVNSNEQGILLYISKLLDLFRDRILQEICNKELFLMATIPFMRGYAQMIGDKNSKDKLTLLMHGYTSEFVDLSSIYNDLFLKESTYKMPEFTTSVEDILNVNLDDVTILKKDNYPLLDKTLRHSLMYLFLRLKVERVLIKKYGVDYNKHQRLGDIIGQAFKAKEDLNNRVYLMSRKTLLNEFNHFDGNMNIFQPAIDISDSSLLNEKEGILKLMGEISSAF